MSGRCSSRRPSLLLQQMLPLLLLLPQPLLATAAAEEPEESPLAQWGRACDTDRACFLIQTCDSVTTSQLVEDKIDECTKEQMNIRLELKPDGENDAGFYIYTDIDSKKHAKFELEPLNVMVTTGRESALTNKKNNNQADTATAKRIPGKKIVYEYFHKRKPGKVLSMFDDQAVFRAKFDATHAMEADAEKSRTWFAKAAQKGAKFCDFTLLSDSCVKGDSCMKFTETTTKLKCDSKMWIKFESGWGEVTEIACEASDWKYNSPKTGKGSVGLKFNEIACSKENPGKLPEAEIEKKKECNNAELKEFCKDGCKLKDKDGMKLCDGGKVPMWVSTELGADKKRERANYVRCNKGLWMWKPKEGGHDENKLGSKEVFCMFEEAPIAKKESSFPMEVVYALVAVLAVVLLVVVLFCLLRGNKKKRTRKHKHGKKGKKGGKKRKGGRKWGQSESNTTTGAGLSEATTQQATGQGADPAAAGDAPTPGGPTASAENAPQSPLPSPANP